MQKKTFFWLSAAAFLILAFLPEILIWLSLPEGQIFNGFFVNIDDASVYFSAIQQGGKGAWLFTPKFSPEIMPTHLAYLPFLLIGKFQYLLGGSSLIWLYVLKLLSLTLALFAFFHLVKTIFPDRLRLQQTAFFMLTFSGGFGWAALIFTGTATPVTPDLFIPEWNLVTSSLGSPHFVLGIAFQAFFLATFFKTIQNSSWRLTATLSLIGTLLGLIYPFSIPVNGLALAFYFIVQTIQKRAIPWQKLLRTGFACLPMVAYLIYYGVILPQDEIWQLSLIANNTILPPPLHGLMVGFGILFILLIPAIKPFLQHPQRKIIPLWLSAYLVAIYLPFPFAGRFILGMIIPAALLAAYGFENILLPKLAPSPRLKPATTRKMVLWFTLPSTILFVVWAFFGAKSTPDYPYYFQETEIEAAQWLAKNTSPDDLILVDYPIGSMLPRYISGRVFAGHLNLTIFLDEKLALINTFWHPDTSQEWRDQFLNEWGITTIYQGRFENRFGGDAKLTIPYPIIYQTDEITIYSIP